MKTKNVYRGLPFWSWNGKLDKKEIARQVHILKEMGAWLKLNGEAIYNSKPWRYCAEGPTIESEGHFQETTNQYTSKDFRFTVNNGAIYATCLSYPEDGELLITSLCLPGGTGKIFFHGNCGYLYG